MLSGTSPDSYVPFDKTTLGVHSRHRLNDHKLCLLRNCGRGHQGQSAQLGFTQKNKFIFPSPCVFTRVMFTN